MGCGSCGSGGGCSTKGCGSSGGCSSGGCNRLNTHNWMSDMPKADFGKMYDIIEVSFNNGSRKDFYRNTTLSYFDKGDMIAVESSVGFDVGSVTLTGEIVKLQMSKKGVKEKSEDIKRVLRKATEDDIAKWQENKPREQGILVRSRAILRELKLEMKLTEVELQADGKKAIFYYISDDRVDFRELIKIYANDFKVKVEMKQIGIRQEAAKVGGIGSCGRELCCSTWLTDFKAVSTLAARYQNLSINQTKLSGQCGRLKCCLNYELDTYMDALQHFPNNAEKIEIATGVAFLQKKDIFKNLMWYSMPGSTKQYPLTIDRVLEIKSLNAKGQKPAELGAEELEKKETTELSDAYVDLTGAISLKSLEKKNKSGNRNNKGNNGPSSRPQNGPRVPNAGNPQQSGAPTGDNKAPQNGTRPPNPNKPQQNGPRPANPNKPPQNGPAVSNTAKPPQNGPRPPRNNPPQNGPANVNGPKPTTPNSDANKPKPEGGNPKFKSNFGGKKPPKDNPPPAE
jgi:cell fate regulator YaaT (PSP1 superfamily)